jgi:hypothetical protein
MRCFVESFSNGGFSRESLSAGGEEKARTARSLRVVDPSRLSKFTSLGLRVRPSTFVLAMKDFYTRILLQSIRYDPPYRLTFS